MFLLFSWIGWEGMIGWIWTRLLSGNHGVRTARQWLNHVLPTVLVLLRWAAPHSIVKCWGTWIYTNLTWIFRIYLQMSSFAGGHVTENLNLRPFFSCCPGFLFQKWLEDIICCRTLFFCCCGFFSITLEINHLDTVKLSTVDWCPTRLQQIWSLCCRTLII